MYQENQFVSGKTAAVSRHGSIDCHEQNVQDHTKIIKQNKAMYWDRKPPLLICKLFSSVIGGIVQGVKPLIEFDQAQFKTSHNKSPRPQPLNENKKTTKSH